MGRGNNFTQETTMPMITPSAQFTLIKGNKSRSSTAVAAALELVDPLGFGPWLSLTAAAFLFFYFFFIFFFFFFPIVSLRIDIATTILAFSLLGTYGALHTALCVFHADFWHALVQYHALLHCEQIFFAPNFPQLSHVCAAAAAQSNPDW
eukprot:FR735860.1.p2 GENE.FR735860.1~~FR735860.1.p2  ORF type:complete len:150 (-),score=35.63 FR735860.1:354-803(-)